MADQLPLQPLLLFASQNIIPDAIWYPHYIKHMRVVHTPPATFDTPSSREMRCIAVIARPARMLALMRAGKEEVAGEVEDRK